MFIGTVITSSSLLLCGFQIVTEGLSIPSPIDALLNVMTAVLWRWWWQRGAPSNHLRSLAWLGRTWLDNLMSDVLSLLLDLTALASLSQITRLLSRSRQSFQIVLGFNRSWTRTPGKHYFFLRNSMIEQFNEHQERETPRSCWDIFPSLDFLKPPSQKDWVRSSALKI